MANIRDNDNFINPRQWIEEQLLVRDYSDEEDANYLKMKLWSLDGQFSPTEEADGETDPDVTVPRNHWAWVQNELVFLDRYIRTQDDQLQKNDEDVIIERNYEELVGDRIIAFKAWIITPKYPDDPENDELYLDWEQDYMSRITRLSTQDFADLYTLYHSLMVQNGFASAFDITSLITGYAVDHLSKSQDQSIQNMIHDDDGNPLDSISEPTPGAQTPTEYMYDKILASGEVAKADKDINYVREMVRYWDEIWIAITDCISDSIIDEPDQPGNPDPIGPPWGGDSWYDAVITNVMLRRHNVVMIADDPSHMGLILNDGGFFYPVLDPELPAAEASYAMQIVETNVGNLVLPAAATVSYPTNVILTNNMIHPNFIGQLDIDHITADSRDLPVRDPSNEDDGSRFWEYVYFSVVNVVPDSDPGYTLVSSLTLGKTLMNLPDLPGTEYDKYDGYDANGDVLMSRQRFLELNSRLVNINRLREDNVSQIGTRVPLESMANADLPDMEADMLDALADRLNQKVNYTSTLVEYCDEWV